MLKIKMRESLSAFVELPSASDHHTPFAWKVPPNLLGSGRPCWIWDWSWSLADLDTVQDSSPLLFFDVNLNFSTRMIANRLHVEGHLVPHPGNLGHLYHPSAKFEAHTPVENLTTKVPPSSLEKTTLTTRSGQHNLACWRSILLLTVIRLTGIFWESRNAFHGFSPDHLYHLWLSEWNVSPTEWPSAKADVQAAQVVPLPPPRCRGKWGVIARVSQCPGLGNRFKDWCI